MENRIYYCSLKNRVLNDPDCECNYNPDECWHFFVVREKELNYLRRVYA